MLPLGVAAVASVGLLPAAMVMNGTDLGYKLHVVRARSYGAFGRIDPWTKSLVRIEGDQERFENVVLPSLPERPGHPAHFGTAGAAIGSADEAAKVAADWVRGIEERTAGSIEAALKAKFDEEHAKSDRLRHVAEVKRKNAMISRNAAASIAQATQLPAEKSINDDD